MFLKYLFNANPKTINSIKKTKLTKFSVKDGSIAMKISNVPNTIAFGSAILGKKGDLDIFLI
ncbi:hypothetical protein VAEU17_2300002 [Vibrio aestuarianus]|nr:hypothetical protein VAEU17_2300002 [Vibrio aestuarianus]